MLARPAPSFSGTQEELSSHGKNETRKKSGKLTEQEYEEALMEAPNGKANWEANGKQFEEAYRRALELNPASTGAHRGLGFLYEREHLPIQGAEEFRKYLQLTPNAVNQIRSVRPVPATP